MVGLKSFLNRLNMTKADLCRELDIDPKSSLLSSYEKGRTYPSYEKCKKLLEMGMTVEELFGREAAIGCSINEFVSPDEEDYKNKAKQAVSETLKNMLEYLNK